jgi:DNA-binding FadR family transcriptional regulator
MAIKNVHGHTLDHLGQAIVGGQYPPGSSIPPEPTLCESLGVSRTVVREAVKSLVAKGMLVTGPKVGTRVLPSDQWNWFDPDVVAWQSKAGLTREFLRDLQELRRVVEPAAVRMAAERATAQDIADIEAAYAGMKDAIEQGGDYVRTTWPSTRACSCLPQPHGGADEQGAGRAAAHQLRDQHLAARRAGHVLPLHRAVLDAVIARNPARAEKASLVLIDGAADDIEQVLASRRKLPSLAQPAAASCVEPRGAVVDQRVQRRHPFARRARR